MSDKDYFDGVVASRGRPAVLLTKVFSFRSGEENVPIIIFEGKTDIGPYEVWFKRINGDFVYKPILAEGKKQALEFRSHVMSTESKFLESIYFVVDKDFDSLRGEVKTGNIFCTDKYSVENYLVSEGVLRSILNDEFECHDEEVTVDNIILGFNAQIQRFCELMADVNFRLFLAAQCNIKKESTGSRLSPYIVFSLQDIEKVYSDDDLVHLIPLDREPTPEEIEQSRILFAEVEDPKSEYRGKFLLSFFLGWIDLLSVARRNGDIYFNAPTQFSFSRASLTLRSLASRSEMPAELPNFLGSIVGLE